MEQKSNNNMKIISMPVKIYTNERLELKDITKDINAFIKQSGLKDGMAIINTLHTTTALFINEYQNALLEDIKEFLSKLVPANFNYHHNNPDFSDCERHNADAHLRSILLSHSITIPIKDGYPVLGTFQSIIFAELDGPRERTINMYVMGSL